MLFSKNNRDSQFNLFTPLQWLFNWLPIKNSQPIEDLHDYIDHPQHQYYRQWRQQFKEQLQSIKDAFQQMGMRPEALAQQLENLLQEVVAPSELDIALSELAKDLQTSLQYSEIFTEIIQTAQAKLKQQIKANPEMAQLELYNQLIRFTGRQLLLSTGADEKLQRTLAYYQQCLLLQHSEPLCNLIEQAIHTQQFKPVLNQLLGKHISLIEANESINEQQPLLFPEIKTTYVFTWMLGMLTVFGLSQWRGGQAGMVHFVPNLSQAGVRFGALMASFSYVSAQLHPENTAASYHIGQEFRVNTCVNNSHSNPAIATLDDDYFVVVWETNGQNGDGLDIYGQVFNATGNKVGTEFLVNTYTSSVQRNPAVIKLKNRDFVVVWETYDLDGSGFAIAGQLFNPVGSKIDKAFQINTSVLGEQLEPTVISFINNSNFAAFWQSDDGSDFGIFGQRFYSNTTKIENEFRVNNYTTSYQQRPTATVLKNDDFFVAWHSKEKDGPSLDLYGQMFNADASKKGFEFPVNTVTYASQQNPATTTLMNGDFFVVVWETNGHNNPIWDIYGQKFNATNGEKVGTEFQVNTGHIPAIAATPSGGFIVAWENGGIFGQLFDADCVKIGKEFQVNTYISSNGNTAVTSLDNGDIVFVWRRYNQDGIAYNDDIYGRIATFPAVTGSSYPLTYIENTLGLLLDPNITLVEKSDFLSSATIQITDGFIPQQDSLNIIDNNPISVTGNNPIQIFFEPSSGTLSLTGEASLEEYQMALRSVTYYNQADNFSTFSRKIVLTIKNAFFDSNAWSYNVTIFPVNDAPVVQISNNEVLNYYPQNDVLPILIDPQLQVHDVDSSELTNASITLVPFVNEDSLIFDNQNGIVGNYNAGWLNLTGKASIRDYEQALRSIRYGISTLNPNVIGSRIITWQVIDDAEAGSIPVNRTLLINLKKDPKSGLLDNYKLIIISIVGGLATIASLVGGISYFLRKKRQQAKNNDTDIEEIQALIDKNPPSVSDSESIGKFTLNTGFNIPYHELTFETKIGQGGFGKVYKGTWLENPVAIKRLYTKRLSPKLIEEFKREVEIMANLRFPQIVSFYGATLNHPYCLVMELLPKGSLYDAIHSPQTLSWEQRHNITLGIAKGLNYLHQKNLVHRDLKSKNILLDANNEPKITDFGLSRLRTEAHNTNSTIAGTPAWMAPELFESKPAYTEKSDIYSFSTIIWEMASGKTPFEKFAGNFLMLISLLKQGEQEAIPQETPPKLAKLITWGWSKNPQDRPTAEVVIQYLQENNNESNSQSISTTNSSLPEYKGNLASLDNSIFLKQNKLSIN